MNDQKKELYEIIKKQVYTNAGKEAIQNARSEDHWLFDFRRVLLNGYASDLITEIFYKEFKNEYPFQICALEVAGIPLLVSAVNKFYSKGVHDINGFFVRKSRKKNGLTRMIEGEIQDDKKIILVDDIINSGSSFIRQIEVLEELGYTVTAVWSVLRFRDTEQYEYFTKRNIAVYSLFSLDDFTNEFDSTVANQKKSEISTPNNLFEAQWRFQSKNPNHMHVVSKSQPTMDENNIYVGSDVGMFYAIDQSTGHVVWQFQTNTINHGKGIFSSPVLYKNTVIFGAYDGNVYCLDAQTGKRIWTNFDGDFIGSSPEINHEKGIVYIGLEFGSLRRKGGIVAIDCTTGKKIWIDNTHQALTHASPLYIKEHNSVVIGSNEGIVYAYDADSGKKLWQTAISKTKSYDWKKDFGFGPVSIKMKPAYDPKRNFIIVTATDGSITTIDGNQGEIINQTCNSDAISNWATPLIHNNNVIWTAPDKHVRCMDLDTFGIVWDIIPDYTRIYSAPVVINDHVYVGTNASRVHKIDPETGKIVDYFQATERVTNSIIYNPNTQQFFLPTFANEIIALKEKTEK